MGAQAMPRPAAHDHALIVRGRHGCQELPKPLEPVLASRQNRPSRRAEGTAAAMMPGGDNDCHFPHDTLTWQHFSARLVVLYMVCSVSSTQRAAQASIAQIMPDSMQQVHLRKETLVRRRWAFLPVSQLAPLLGVGQYIHGPCRIVNDWRAENTNSRLHASILISTTNMHVHHRM